MRNFIDKDFLLKSETAKHLFFDYAKDMPIYDYHCHLNPYEIYEDKKYKNITEMWLYGDHYKWRFMRSMGVDEKYCTGDASDYEKFCAYAKCLGMAIGNPLYHWSHLELQRYFGICDCLNEKTADDIWNRANKVIESPDFSARKIIEKSNVMLIGTTDDPADDLAAHKALKEDKSFKTKVVPAFRPDNAGAIGTPGFKPYMEKLGKACGFEIKSFADLKRALSDRIDYFNSVGSKISDHGIARFPYRESTEDELEKIFSAALSGAEISPEDAEKYKTALLIFLGGEYSKRDWVMQLHMSAIRRNNSRMTKLLGADTGFDSVDDGQIAYNLNHLLDAMDREGKLPKTILYSLNEKDNYVLGTTLGNFQGSGVKGKIQLGSGWWFNDNIDGMTSQIKALGNLGALAAFVGMLTDSRSILSYPRHEYFRRILCNIIGTWVEDGEFSSDDDILKQIVQDICCNNAVKYFNM